MKVVVSDLRIAQLKVVLCLLRGFLDLLVFDGQFCWGAWLNVTRANDFAHTRSGHVTNFHEKKSWAQLVITSPLESCGPCAHPFSRTVPLQRVHRCATGEAVLSLLCTQSLQSWVIGIIRSFWGPVSATSTISTFMLIGVSCLELQAGVCLLYCITTI